jgi:hypothetical protein
VNSLRRGAPRPKRKRTFFEYQWPWLAITVLLSGVTCALVLLFISGILGEPVAFRGHSWLNVSLALVGILLFSISGFYVLRKRMFAEELGPVRSSMQAWLWAHIYLALLGTLLVLLHAGYSLFSPALTSGKLALLAMLLTIGSGVLWRTIYAWVPRSAARSVGNYSFEASREEAAELEVEIEKLSAGKSHDLHRVKQELLRRNLSERELAERGASLGPHERSTLSEVAGLARKRQMAQLRALTQQRYVKLLQGWRLLHFPVSLLFLAAVPVHVVLAYQVPAHVVPPGSVDGSSLGAFETADACEGCHAEIVEQWRGSLHAHAMTRATMITQTNQDLEKTLVGTEGPDPKDLCINCHGPIGALLTRQSTLPLGSNERLLENERLLNEGVSCSVCHQYTGGSRPGQAALSRFADAFTPGRTYFGPIEDPVPNSFHRSEHHPLFDEPHKLCANCHSVNYDLDRDNTIVKGKDLVLQTVFEEWEDYRKKGGSASCVDCHMPISQSTRAAESAWIPFEQDYDARQRRVRDHAFVGADHRLDISASEDPHAGARTRLLKSAATLTVEAASVAVKGDSVLLTATVANVGAGHRLPSGFAFVRQLWLEVSVRDREGRVLASSGLIDRVDRDLCDSGLFEITSRAMLQFAQGCQEEDPLLVNFQSILIDKVEPAQDADGNLLSDELGHSVLEAAPGARETTLQYFTGGPIARRRGIEMKAVVALEPNEERSFAYEFKLGRGIEAAHDVRVRLMFRAIAPYFLRALGAEQAAGEPPVAPQVKNLRIDELGAVTVGLEPR